MDLFFLEFDYLGYFAIVKGDHTPHNDRHSTDPIKSKRGFFTGSEKSLLKPPRRTKGQDCQDPIGEKHSRTCV